MTQKLKEIVFIKTGNIYKGVGIYVTVSPIMQGEDMESNLSTLVEGESYYQVRREAKRLAYSSCVGFFDTVNPEFNELSKLEIRSVR